MIDVIRKRFEAPDETRGFEKGTLELVRLGPLTIGRATYQPGWKWSAHVGPTVGASRCTVEHVGMVLSGSAAVAFDDGRIVELREGCLFHVPPLPHDSWVIGATQYVSLHLMGADTYARRVGEDPQARNEPASPGNHEPQRNPSIVKAPEIIETRRLTLQRPRATDAEAIFGRYASDRAVTRFMSWPAHRTLDDTRAFLAFSEAEWHRWPAGPYLARSRADGTLLGGTGLAFETPYRAVTGYIFAKNVWGQGYATEALQAMVEVARATGVRRLSAVCHPEHRASWRVLEKCGFAREGILRHNTEFPNLRPGEPSDVLCYALAL